MSITSKAIVQAALKLRNGQKQERCMLRDIRPLLSGTHEQQTAALLQAQKDGLIVLYREDNTPALKQADHDAAVILAGGNPRHLLYVL